MPQMIKCVNCKRSVSADARPCPYCGHPDPNSKVNWVAWAIGIFFVLALLGGASV